MITHESLDAPRLEMAILPAETIVKEDSRNPRPKDRVNRKSEEEGSMKLMKKGAETKRSRK